MEGHLASKEIQYLHSMQTWETGLKKKKKGGRFFGEEEKRKKIH